MNTTLALATSAAGVEIAPLPMWSAPHVVLLIYGVSAIGLIVLGGVTRFIASTAAGAILAALCNIVLINGVGPDVDATVERLEEHYGIEVATAVEDLEDRTDIITRHPNGDLADAVLLVDEDDETASIWVKRPGSTYAELEAAR